MQLVIFQTFVSIFFREPRVDVRLPSQILQTVQMRGKLEKFTEMSLASDPRKRAISGDSSEDVESGPSVPSSPSPGPKPKIPSKKLKKSTGAPSSASVGGGSSAPPSSSAAPVAKSSSTRPKKSTDASSRLPPGVVSAARLARARSFIKK